MRVVSVSQTVNIVCDILEYTYICNYTDYLFKIFKNILCISVVQWYNINSMDKLSKCYLLILYIIYTIISVYYRISDITGLCKELTFKSIQ